MSALPPELAQWRASLQGFDADVALTLRAPIRRLAALLGPFHRQDPAGRGEPAGFDGISLRGRYEHLLLSEWLLADEVPDEFLRRAVDREHAFLAPRRLDPRASRRCVVLFDAGPDQLGSPRLVHLAALFVLHERAVSGGAEFAWGLLGDEAYQLSTVVAPSSVGRLQGARRLTPIGADGLDGWLEVLGSIEHPDDLWLVGGPRLDALAAPGSRLRIEERFEPGPSVVEVQFVGRAARPIRLQLPEDARAVALLRRPLDQPYTPPVITPPRPRDARTNQCAPTGHYHFSPCDNRLLCLDPDGRLHAHHVPNGPIEALSPGRTRSITSQGGYRVIGAAFWARRPTALLLNDESSTLAVQRGRGKSPAFPVPSEMVLPTDLVLLRQGGPRRLLEFVDGAQQLWRINVGSPGEGQIRRVANGVCGLSGEGWLTRFGQGGETLVTFFDPDGEHWMFPVGPALGGVLLRGRAVAGETEPGVWHLGRWQDENVTRLQVPDRAQVHDLWADALVFTLPGDPCGLHAMSISGEVKRIVAEGPITRVTLAESRRFAACRLASGDIEVLSFDDRQPIRTFRAPR